VSTRAVALPSLRAAKPLPDAEAATAVTMRALLGSRLIVWGAGLFALALFGRNLQVIAAMDANHLTEPFSSAAANFAFAPAARWDSVWYLAIAHGGYFSRPSSAYFPLYPFLIHTSTVLFRSALLAGTVISVVSMTVALYVLYLLSRLDLGEAQARATVMLVAFFPMAFFLSAVYTEALYLLLSVGAIYAARLDRWAWAGVLGALASATRPSGFLILLPLAWLYLYGPRDAAPLEQCPARWRPRYAVSRSVIWLALVPVGILAYLGYLWAAHHAPLAPFQVELEWGRKFAGPFGAVVKALVGVPGDLHRELTHSTVSVGAGDPISWTTHNFIDLGFLAFAAAGLALSWRRVPRAYFAYAVVLLVEALSYPIAAEPLESFPRYVLAMFPLFMGWGAWLGPRPRLNRSVICVSALLLAAFSGLWAFWAWVA
jgi:Mannosyltransferase (PIG-V)